MTPEAIVQMQAHYEIGNLSKREIARKYGINHTVVDYYAKKEGWQPYGTRHEEAMEAAKGKVTDEIVKSYTDVVKEINESHLKSYRYAHELVKRLMSHMGNRINYIDMMNAKAMKEAQDNGKPLPKPMSSRDEILALDRLINALRQATIEGERFILGIKEGSLEKEDPTNGAREISKILEEARAEFGDLSSELPEYEEETGES